MSEALLFGIGSFLIDTPWYVLGCVPFMEQARVKKGRLICIMLFLGLLKGVTGFALAAWIPDWRDWRSLHYVAHTIVILVFYFLAFRVKFVKLLYTFLLLQAVSTTVNFLAYTILVPFYPGKVIGIASTPIYTMMIVAGNALAFPFVWRFFKGRLRDAFAELADKSILLLCIPPLLFYAINQGYVAITTSVGLNISSIVLLLILATGLVTYYINLRTVMDGARQARREAEMTTHLELQAQGYKNLTKNIEAARIARHDLRHHLNIIRDRAAQNDSAGLLKYLDEYAAALPPDGVPDFCTNRVVNALLHHYLAVAKQAGAQLDIKLNLPDNAGVPDADLCVVFGNVFENAAKSVAAQTEAEPFIHARCETGLHDIVLTVKNSVGGAEGGDGLGLRSVEAVAKKHGGKALFELRDGVYHSNIILTVSEGREDET